MKLKQNFSSFSDLRSVLLLFDIDGTLTDTNAIDGACFKSTMEELYGLDLSTTDWSEFEHVTDSGITNELYKRNTGNTMSPKEILRVQNLFVEKLTIAQVKTPETMKALPGVDELMAKLRSHHVPMAIATGGWRKSAQLKLKASEVEYDPFVMATSNDSPHRRTIINVAIARAQFEYQQQFSNIIYFGDGIWDVNTCEAMQIPMIGIDFHKNEKLIALGVKHVFSDFKNVNAIVDAIYDLLNTKHG